MADTLLFRGGSSADITASTVQNRELVIDTDTDQIVSGTSKKKTVMEDATGNVEIGGGSIELNANGGATFAGDAVYIYDGASAPGTVRLGTTTGTTYGGLSLYRSSQTTAGTFLRCFSGASREQVFQINELGDVRIGGTLPSSPNISLNADGSATFAGSVSSEALMNASYFAASIDNSYAFYIGPNSKNAGGLYTANNAGQLYLRDGDTDVQTIFLNGNNGEADFAGKIEVGARQTDSSSGQGALINSTGTILSQRPSGQGTSPSWQGWLGTSTTSQIYANGSSEFAGDITCTNNSKGLVLKSPNGTSFRLSVADDGTLSATSI